jgi:hypothetical protein
VRTVRAATALAALALGTIAWTPYDANALAADGQVDLGGQPITGSTDSRDATPISAGLWSATLGPDAQHFTYERQIEGSTVHVGVIGAGTPTDTAGVQVDATVRAPEGADALDCGSDYDSPSSSVPQGVLGAHVIVGNEDDGGTCRDADSVDIAVSQYSPSGIVELPIAIKIVEEAPAAQAEGPPEESPELSYDPPERAEPTTEPAGASSFDDAPVVDARDQAVTIATEVGEGTQLMWRVPLDWGDQLVVGGELAAVSGADAERLGYPSVAVRLQIVEPDRDTFALTESADYSESTYGGEEATPLFAATFPLRYANRFGDQVPTLPGDHWVSVAVSPPPEEREALDVPVELTFEVTSTDVPRPTYKAAVLAQSGDSGPDGYSPDTPYLVGDGEFSAVASGNPFTPEDTDEGWWGGRHLAGLGLGVMSLACCAAGAVWLSRRSAARR